MQVVFVKIRLQQVSLTTFVLPSREILSVVARKSFSKEEHSATLTQYIFRNDLNDPHGFGQPNLFELYLIFHQVSVEPCRCLSPLIMQHGSKQLQISLLYFRSTCSKVVVFSLHSLVFRIANFVTYHLYELVNQMAVCLWLEFQNVECRNCVDLYMNPVCLVFHVRPVIEYHSVNQNHMYKLK